MKLVITPCELTGQGRTPTGGPPLQNKASHTVNLTLVSMSYKSQILQYQLLLVLTNIS